MPSYKNLDPTNAADRRTIKNLQILRKHLSQEIPARSLESTLILATWNIREFNSKAYGERTTEAFHYIAEIISRFDMVAIQEVRKDLKALDRLCGILGDFWEYVVTDVTSGSKGNKERLAFLYDSRKIRFGGLASELVLPPLRLKDANNKTVYQPVTQLARTPFMCGFEAGWSRFILTTVHILYGQSKANDPRRVEEIRQIAQFLKERSTDRTAWSRNLILLGDFNIFKPADKTMAAMLNAGFIVPENIQSLPSNVRQNKHYDQVAFRLSEDRLGTTGKAGVFNYYETVFRNEDVAQYIPDMGESYFKTSSGKVRANKDAYFQRYWRTHQMSDHLPMWVELKIDYSDRYLERKLEDLA